MIPIGISTIEVNPDGALLLYTDTARSNLGEFQRRVQRNAALDGGVVVVDNGFTHADRTVRVDLSNESQAVNDAARLIVELYSAVLVFLPDGAYRAVPERYAASGSVATLTLLLTGPAEVRL